MSEYHCSDFSFDEWAAECNVKFTLPKILPTIDVQQLQQPILPPVQSWDQFFSSHNSGNFFKPRRYLALEFEQYLKCSTDITILEVGCGHGCSMYPLLEVLPNVKYIATDYSLPALQILKSHPSYDETRIPVVARWDITEPPPVELSTISCNVILSVFALSAVHHNYHRQCLQYMKDILCHAVNNNSNSSDRRVILFRDYAIHDMTMYRHTVRYSENLYQRTDGTLSYYFDKDYLTTLCSEVGLDVLDLEYATVENKNRKKGEVMRRVFVHAVFAVPL